MSRQPTGGGVQGRTKIAISGLFPHPSCKIMISRFENLRSVWKTWTDVLVCTPCTSRLSAKKIRSMQAILKSFSSVCDIHSSQRATPSHRWVPFSLEQRSADWLEQRDLVIDQEEMESCIQHGYKRSCMSCLNERKRKRSWGWLDLSKEVDIEPH